MKYRSRPSEIEAIQWAGDNYAAIQRAINAAGEKVLLNGGALYLKAGADGAQDWVPVPVGHYIVHMPGDLSDIWPVEESYFRDKYEALCSHGHPSSQWNFCCDYEP